MDILGNLFFAFLYDIFASLPTTIIRIASLKDRESYDDITPVVQSQQITYCVGDYLMDEEKCCEFERQES